MVLRWLLALLVVTTLLGLYANEHWMTRQLALDGRGAGQHLEIVDDAGSGGKSKATLEAPASGPLTMRCEIHHGFEWPFCELQIEMKDRDLDLRNFSHIRLWLHAEGPTLDGGAAQVRVFLRNFNPVYSRQGAAEDLKPQEVIFAPSAQRPAPAGGAAPVAVRRQLLVGPDP